MERTDGPIFCNRWKDGAINFIEIQKKIQRVPVLSDKSSNPQVMNSLIHNKRDVLKRKIYLIL